MRSEATIKEILQPKILSCTPDTLLETAAQRMSEAHCSSILIMEDGKALGIWTEHDAVALDMGDPARFRLPVYMFMSSPVMTIRADATLGEAALRFREEDIRHFVVTTQSGEIAGVISQSDVVLNQGIEYFVSLRELGTVFTRRFAQMPTESPLAAAVAEMRRGRHEAMIVRAADGRLGIVTERDILKLIGAAQKAATIGEIASFPLLTLPFKATLYHARKQFRDHRVRHLGVTDEHGNLIGLISFSDILANIEHEYVLHLREALRESEASLASTHRQLRSATKVFENTYEGIMVTNAERVIESVNPAFTRITGYESREVVGKTPSVLASGRHDKGFYQAMYDALAAHGHWHGEICNRHKNGSIYVEWTSINAITDEAGQVTNYVAVFSDFTARKAVEEQMRFMALHDGLTGLPNRSSLMQRLAHAIPHARRNRKKLALLFVDLDELKGANDRYGHEAGDYMLRTVADRLQNAARASDTVARLGGDEFVMLLENLAEPEPVSAFAEKVLASVGEAMHFAGREIRTTASIGVVIYPDHTDDPDELLREADHAMYTAKGMGGNQICYVDSAV
jgi:diguanylate cyclase (GGDEF)-like protein/PAS domain S-box-containing protein